MRDGRVRSGHTLSREGNTSALSTSESQPVCVHREPTGSLKMFDSHVPYCNRNLLASRLNYLEEGEDSITDQGGNEALPLGIMPASIQQSSR